MYLEIEILVCPPPVSYVHSNGPYILLSCFNTA